MSSKQLLLTMQLEGASPFHLRHGGYIDGALVLLLRSSPVLRCVRPAGAFEDKDCAFEQPARLYGRKGLGIAGRL